MQRLMVWSVGPLSAGWIGPIGALTRGYIPATRIAGLRVEEGTSGVAL